MNRETFYVWILLFFIKLTFITALIESVNDTITNEANSVLNVSSEYNITIEETNSGFDSLEPSVEIDINNINNEFKSNSKKQPSETLADHLNLINDVKGSNDSPFFLTPETSSSARDIDRSLDISLLVTSRNAIEDNLIALTEEIPLNVTSNLTNITNTTVDTTILKREDERNTEDKPEEIPSFSEWAQKRLEEVEKNQVNSSKTTVTNGKTQGTKLRWKNYASLDCGAKVVAANPESVRPGAILSQSSDEYKLNPCTSRIWFIVELCEAIQIKRIDLANYELFSSSPKDFTVLVSERFPTRDWSFVGKFTAKDERDLQSFDFETDLFGKYIKVEIKSHYGSEHYCPISLFRAYGTSVFEVLQKEDPTHENPDEDDEDLDDDIELSAGGHPHKNLFSSATDAVISMVKRAAEALGNKVGNQTSRDKINDTVSQSSLCNSPRHLIICHNCNETVFSQVYELLSCKTSYIQKLVNIPAIYKALLNSFSCRNFGLDFRTNFSGESSYTDDLQTFFPTKYIGAMCNEVALINHQGSLNITQQYLNVTKKLTNDKIVNLEVNPPEQSLLIPNSTLPMQDIKTDLFDLIFNATESEEISLAEHIKPTKALNPDSKLEVTMNNSTFLDVPHEPIEIVSNVVKESPISMDNLENGSTAPILDTITVTETAESLEEHVDMISSESDSQGTIAPSSTTASLPQAAKESIFLRLSNRIKALERNMSLSGQYLEELSKRYKKQVEEMQTLLEKTLVAFREENIKANERHRNFEERLNSLSANVENLLTERQILFSVLYMSVIIILVSYCVYFFCGKHPTNYKSGTERHSEVLRRSSVDVLIQKPHQEKKKRRHSDQVMKIVRYSSVQEDDKARKSRKRKKSKIIRSNSTSSLKIIGKCSGTKRQTDWVESNRQDVEDIPFPLEESDICILENFISPRNNLGNESPKSDASQNFFEHRNNVSADTDRTEKAKNNASFNNSNKGDILSLNEPVKKEKKSFKKLLKKVF